MIVLIKCNINFFSIVFFINTQPTFQLDFDKSIAIYMTSDKISSLPVIVKPHTVKSIISQLECYFLKI